MKTFARCYDRVLPLAKGRSHARGGGREPLDQDGAVDFYWMEVIEYRKSEAGMLKCPRCQGLTPAWRSSGMSQACPHFYCERCSNVIVLDEPSSPLPLCECGGQFSINANPKCGRCGAEIPLGGTPEQRLGNPYMIVADGACVFSDRRPPYRVRIIDG